jgi:hypothetical protein
MYIFKTNNKSSMGIGKSKSAALTTYELQDFADMTNLKYDEVEYLHKLFRVISAF